MLALVRVPFVVSNPVTLTSARTEYVFATGVAVFRPFRQGRDPLPLLLTCSRLGAE